MEGFSESSYRKSEDGKKPSQSKEGHHSSDADHQTDDSFVADRFLFSSSCAFCVSNEYHDDPDKDNKVKYQHGKDWSEKSSPEGSNVRQKAAIIIIEGNK